MDEFGRRTNPPKNTEGGQNISLQIKRLTALIRVILVFAFDGTLRLIDAGLLNLSCSSGARAVRCRISPEIKSEFQQLERKFHMDGTCHVMLCLLLINVSDASARNDIKGNFEGCVCTRECRVILMENVSVGRCVCLHECLYVCVFERLCMCVNTCALMC